MAQIARHAHTKKLPKTQVCARKAQPDKLVVMVQPMGGGGVTEKCRIGGDNGYCGSGKKRLHLSGCEMHVITKAPSYLQAWLDTTKKQATSPTPRRTPMMRKRPL